MGQVDEIRTKIENLVKGGNVAPREIITVPNLPRDLAILLYACYAGGKDFEIEREVTIDPNNPNQETYTLYLKYTGKQNA